MQEEQERPEGGFFGTGGGGNGGKKLFPPWLKLLLSAIAFSVTPVSMYFSDGLKQAPLPGSSSAGGVGKWGPYYLNGQDILVLLFFTGISLYLWFRFFSLLVKIFRK